MLTFADAGNFNAPGFKIFTDNSLFPQEVGDYKILLVGGKAAAGGAADNKVVSSYTAEDAEEKFGSDSELHLMSKGFLLNNVEQELLAFPLGAANTITDLLAEIGDKRFIFISAKGADADRVSFKNELNTVRWNGDDNNSGIVCFASKKNYADLITLGDGLDDHTSSTVGYFGSTDAEGVFASCFYGQALKQLKRNPAGSLAGYKVEGLDTPNNTGRFKFSERNVFAGKGISSYSVNDLGDIFLQGVYSNYTTNKSYRPLQNVYLSMLVRDYQIANLSKDFQGYSITSDEDLSTVSGGVKITSPLGIKTAMIGYYEAMLTKGWVQRSDLYQTSLKVNLDPDDPTLVQMEGVPIYNTPYDKTVVINRFKNSTN